MGTNIPDSLIQPDVSNIQDFCQQCAFLLRPEIRPNRNDYFHMSCKMDEGSTCPLCLFFASAIFGQDSLRSVPETKTFLFSHKPMWTPEVRDPKVHWNYSISTEGTASTRFIHPISGSNDSQLRLLPKSMVDYSLFRKWIAYCKENHKWTCHNQDRPLQGWTTSSLKLIDCKTGKITRASRDAQYVALSYVWGHGRTSELPHVDKNVDDSGLEISSLPTTIQDAIEVTLNIGFRYLWVDKYCIDQANPHELLMQISMMDMVYSAAAVTIVAAAGQDSSYGLPGVSERVRIKHPTIRLNETTWKCAIRDLKYPIPDSPWCTRAWTYQEEFFSLRLLIFTSDQVIFECSNLRCFELLPTDEPDDIQSYHIDHSSSTICQQSRVSTLTHAFHQHIERYTHRELSYQSDALNALRGLFQSFSSNTDSWIHYWGIPVRPPWYRDHLEDELSEQDQFITVFCEGLCWLTNTEPSATLPQTRREGFPSWSWAGWIRPIYWSEARSLRKDGRRPSRVFALKKDATETELTTELASDIFNHSEALAFNYTYNLRVHVEVLDITFSYLEDDIHMHPRAFDGMINPKPIWSKYVARAILRNKSKDASSQANLADSTRKNNNNIPSSYEIARPGISHFLQDQTIYWPLLLTPLVKTNEELDLLLSNKSHVFNALILSNTLALVTRNIGTVAERVGVLLVYGMTAEPALSVSRDYFHLREAFPGCRRDIILG